MALTIRRPYKTIQTIGVVFVTTILLSITTIANEDNTLIESYDQFNSELINSEFSEASRLLGEGNIRDSMKILKAADIDNLRSFYSKKLSASNKECYSRSLCRESDLIFLSILAFTEYEIVSIGKINGKSVKMGVSGMNGSTIKIKLVVNWLREDGEWKIDELMKVPTNWNIKFK